MTALDLDFVRKATRRNSAPGPTRSLDNKTMLQMARRTVIFTVDAAGLAELKPGAIVSVESLFETGQKVDVQGVTIGKGYAGVIKRHHFKSNRASHGNSRSHNVPGSIGMAQDPGRVFPGKRMTGHLGDVTRTTQNLEIARVDADRGLLLVKGAVPGAKNGSVVVKHAVKRAVASPVKKGA